MRSLENMKYVPTISLTLDLRLKLSGTNYQWYSVLFSRQNNSYLTIVATNINEYKQRLEEFRETDEQLRIAAGYSKVVLWYFDDTSTPLRIVAKDLLLSAIGHTNWSTIRHSICSDYLEEVSRHIRNALVTQKPLVYETPLFFRTFAWVCTRGFATGRPGELMGCTIDISAIKETTIALEESKKIVEEGLAAKSTFLMKMSYAIHVPLYAMCSLIQLLDAATQNPEQKQMIGVVDKSLERLTDLIDDALDLTRIEKHVLPLDYKKFDPKFVLNTRLRPFANAADQKGLRLIVRIDPSFPILFWGEPVCFGRIVASLLSNAVKFTSEGHVNVDMGFVDDKLLVRVDDTGIGIKQEDQSRVFDLFTQGDSSCTRPYEGTGVGLALVKSILDLLGGSISMQSRLGEGSSFVARFPFEPLLVPFVPHGLRKLHRQVLLLSSELDGNQLGSFADFYGFEVVSEAQVATERLSLVLLDAAQKSRALEVRARKSGPVLLFVVGDDPTNDGRFRWLHKSLWMLEMSEILQHSLTSDSSIGADEGDGIATFHDLNVLVIDSDGSVQLVLR
jgi:signal transduction histidine kinase